MSCLKQAFTIFLFTNFARCPHGAIRKEEDIPYVWDTSAMLFAR